MGAGRKFLLQTAGMPGSGKSTLARAIGHGAGAVVLDKDVIKSAALHAGAEESLAGPLAYEVFFDQARSLLGMGHSVVLDSPAFWPSILDRGALLAAEAAADYFIIECKCPDRQELARRLATRPRMASQYDSPGDDAFRLPGTAPLSLPHLVVDTTRQVDECLRLVLDYIRAESARRAASSPAQA